MEKYINSDKEKIEIIMIRHGITMGNVEKRFMGCKTDIPLTKEGRSALLENEYPKVNLLFSSPMIRCVETASVIYPGQKPVLIDELKEIDFGDFENLNHKELNGNPEYQAWLDSAGKNKIPNGDDMNSYISRVSIGLKKIKEIAREKGERKVAAVVHGGTIMAAGAYLGESDYFSGIVDNGGIRVFKV